MSNQQQQARFGSKEWRQWLAARKAAKGKTE